jgi:hypothetical protein
MPQQFSALPVQQIFPLVIARIITFSQFSGGLPPVVCGLSPKLPFTNFWRWKGLPLEVFFSIILNSAKRGYTGGNPANPRQNHTKKVLFPLFTSKSS